MILPTLLKKLFFYLFHTVSEVTAVPALAATESIKTSYASLIFLVVHCFLFAIGVFIVHLQPEPKEAEYLKSNKA